MDLSIVTTLYRSAAHLQEFYTRSKREAEKISEDYEIIFVNDGSPDNSLELAISLYECDPHVKVYDLSRNFGHHKAMMTGLRQAQGKLIFLIDSDLEEEPELFSAFYEKFKSHQTADVVYGVQEQRKGSLFEQLSGEIFYSIFNKLSAHPIPRNLVVARLMSRRYVDALISHEENELIIAGLFASTGFEQIPYTIHKYDTSKTTYNFAKKVDYMVKSITSFSSKPLVYIAYLGGLIVMLSFVYILYLLILYVSRGTVPEGYTSLIVSIWLIGGLMIFSLGIVAIYLSVIFTEIKHRPFSIIRQRYEHTENGN
jgi:putative glycosyltransferase